MGNSLINKQYVPIDNSYSANLSDGQKKYLASCLFSDGTITTIVSEIYTVKISGKMHEFIRVETPEGETHQVMYYPHGVVTEQNTAEQILNKGAFRNKDYFYDF